MNAAETPSQGPGTRDSQGRWTHDRQGNPIDRNAPSAGQPTRRNKPDGSTEYWCGTCDRWGNHDDDHHEQFLERRRVNRNRRGGGNGGNDTSSTAAAVPTTTDRPGSMHRATMAQPILSLLSGRINQAYDSDSSF